MHRYTKLIAFGIAVILPVVLLAQTGSTTDSTSTAGTTTPTTTTTTNQTTSTTNTTTAPSLTPRDTTTTTNQGGTAAATATNRIQECVLQLEQQVSRARENVVFLQCPTALTRVAQSVRARELEEKTAIAQSRALWDKIRAGQFTALRVRATTEQQKRAVEAFIETTNTAVSMRKQGVNTAVDTYHAGRKLAVAGKLAVVEKHTQTLSTVRQNARTECTLGVENNTVRERIAAQQSIIEASQQSVTTACRGADTGIADTGTDLTARTEAIERPLAEFRARAAAARTELRAAFGLPAGE